MNKYFNKIMIIDGSYLLQRNLHINELWELKNKYGERSGGIFGFLRSLNYEFNNTDYYPVVTWDDGLSPRRVKVYEKYKQYNLRYIDSMLHNNPGMTDDEIKKEMSKSFSEESIDEAINSISQSLNESMDYDRKALYENYDPDDFRSQYHRQRGVLINILNSLGVPSILIHGWEGDDLMVLLTRMSSKSLILTDDRDLVQMLSPDVQVWRPMHREKLEYESYMKSTGYHNIRQEVIYKAIIGDGSDNIPSVTSGLDRSHVLGAGRAGAVAEIISDNNEDPNKYIPVLQSYNKNYYNGFISRHDDYIRNMKLVDLSLVENDETTIGMISAEVFNRAGKCNFLDSLTLLSEQDITNFDINSFVSKINIISTSIKYSGE